MARRQTCRAVAHTSLMRDARQLAAGVYSVTGLSETSQSLPLKAWMNSVFIGV